MTEFENSQQLIEIPQTLVAPKHYSNQEHILTQKCKNAVRIISTLSLPLSNASLDSYNTVGSNGFFEAVPSVVNFDGFETRRTIMKKVKVINNTHYPQRINILPPSTPQFKIHFDKKGVVAPGMGEEIYVQFTPSDYKYHYDCIRVHCAGEKILIPIHGYPVINQEVERLTPAILDFGKKQVHQEYTKVVNIQCTVPVNFQFQFRYIQQHPDIQIVPIRGDIYGLSKTKIEVIYRPSSYTTAIAECLFKTSEFNSKPEKIHISGAAETGIVTIVKEETEQSYYQEQKQPTLLMGEKRQMREMRDRPRQLPAIEKPPQLHQVESGSIGGFNAARSLKAELESIKMQSEQGPGGEEMQKVFSTKSKQEEQAFLQKFRKIEALDREKEIKFFSCIGDDYFSPQEMGEVSDKRKELIDEEIEFNRNRDILRHKSEANQDFVIIDTDLHPYFSPLQKVKEAQRGIRTKTQTFVIPKPTPLPTESQAHIRAGSALSQPDDMGVDLDKPLELKNYTSAPKWEVFRNDQLHLRKRAINKFTQVATTIITRFRAGKRLEKLRMKLQEAGIKDKADAKKLVAQEWKAMQHATLSSDEGHIKFTFFGDMAERNIEVQFCQLPVQYDVNILSFKEKVDAQPPSSFDDLAPYDEIEPLDFEIMAYKPHQIPAYWNYLPQEKERVLRPGCENEYAGLGERGIPDMPVLTMPDNLLKEFELQGEKMVLPHPTIRRYYKMKKFSEVDPEYPLYPQVRKPVEVPDELKMKNANKSKDGQTMLRTMATLGGSAQGLATHNLPGNVAARVLQGIEHEIQHFYRPHFEVEESLACDSSLVGLPQLMTELKQVDIPTESDSEGDDEFDVKIPDLNQLIADLEKEDPVLDKEKQAYEEKEADRRRLGIQRKFPHIVNETADQLKLLDLRISKQREKQASTQRCQIQELNGKISCPEHRISLQ